MSLVAQLPTIIATTTGELPGGFHLGSNDTFWVAVGTIILATFITEDATSIIVGMLIGTGQLNPVAGLTGCFIGIFIGDFGLWLFGWLLGKHVFNYKWVQKRFPDERLDHMRNWFCRYGWSTIIASRFLPGTRIPAFMGAGLVGGNIKLFLLWIGVAGLLWTPFIVYLSAIFGSAVEEHLDRIFGSSIISLILGLALIIFILHNTVLLLSRMGRARLHARWARLWRYEFWPGWVFYIPLIPWCIWLIIKYRGFSIITASNPCIPSGGIVGESKSDILDRLPPDTVIPYAHLIAETPDQATDHFQTILTERSWDYPLIIKPDASQRGVGLALVHNLDDVITYFADGSLDVIVQQYHPGPGEAGIFYVRIPGDEKGHIFSITDKVFPVLHGNGTSTFRQLIWAHPRYRFQANVFLQRHLAHAEQVIPAGKDMDLVIAGNHCQGTMFRDGSRFITPQLEARIDAIAKQVDGFYFGRFDVRYTDPEAFRRGEEIAIVELNGASSESTNLYDPTFSVFTAYRFLFAQWELLFQIGALNARNGHPTTTIPQLIREIRSFYKTRTVSSTVSQ